ncbi:ornithine cyclodeaminase family protein [Rhodobacter sp. NTK016B]|uniref:ornithine cyclodeaminase family protein n=1 Tax=Rhodobacter sp. NTK016B TaxID=2759676 RepID=UPI001A8DE61F|nr:ornithine cyclodeaminase family protein [Rhodobacter sp. NTK016B]MBN8293575.1 ornithine cyclodeaminase family protein [Rhodobacter sp. NTK016B]
MRLLSNADVADLLPMAEAIAVIDTTMRTVSRGDAELPLRHVVPVGGKNMMGVMSGALGDPACYGVKLVSLFPGNPAKGLSGHRGAVVLFDSEDGGAVAMMDAGLLTAIRTAAASGVATRALARPEATRLTIIGTGEQAEHHLAAMLAVRDIDTVHVVGRRAEKAAAFVEHARSQYPGAAFSHGTDAQAGVRGADIVCTVTNAATPVLMGDWLEPGQHLNIVGASMPGKREIDDAVLRRSELFFDYRPSLLAQAEEIISGLKAGTITEADLKSEIGAVLAGGPGRPDAQSITLYRSLGIVAQDLAAATHVLARAEAEDRGTAVDF